MTLMSGCVRYALLCTQVQPYDLGRSYARQRTLGGDIRLKSFEINVLRDLDSDTNTNDSRHQYQLFFIDGNTERVIIEQTDSH